MEPGEAGRRTPPICVILPDGQEVRARLHARRRHTDGWQYQVGILTWQDGRNDTAEPVEHRAWISPAHARPLPDVSYQHVPTHPPPPADSSPHRKHRPAWTVQHLPHRPGHPGATLIHVIGCTPSNQTLNREQALTALHQPRATACTECAAASSLTDHQDETQGPTPPSTPD
ncbi:DUF6233 domain-containing protein [Streptomyces chryseus]